MPHTIPATIVPRKPYSFLPEKWLGHTGFQVAVLLFLCGASFFCTLGAVRPGLMEARNFITAREMVQEGQWLLPTMNGYLRLAKPPLPTWLTALSGQAFGDIEHLAALRLPAAIMATLLVLFLYLLARQLTPDNRIPFWAAAVLTTSVGFVDYGRQATWDIYCHSFMLGAVWLLFRAFRAGPKSLRLYFGSGLLMGLSFMSKGPVSFYALLLPFLLAYGFGFGWRSISLRGMLLALLACVLVSMPWPLLVYLTEPQAFLIILKTETSSWLNRHPQPFWYYWNFTGQAGIWLVFATLALAVPYARRRIRTYGNYTFLAGWVLLSLVLLSLVTEKKARYLLPLMPPLALLTAFYLHYLLEAIRRGTCKPWELRMVQVNAILWALVAFVLPIALFVFYRNGGAVPGAALVMAPVLFLLLGGMVLHFMRSRQLSQLFLTGMVLHALAIAFLVPHMEEAQQRVGNYESMEEVRQLRKVQSLPYFAVDGMNPKHVWEVGKPVDTLRVVRGQLQIPKRLPAVVFSRVPLTQAQLGTGKLSLQVLHAYHFNPKKEEEVFYLHILR